MDVARDEQNRRQGDRGAAGMEADRALVQGGGGGDAVAQVGGSSSVTAA